MQVFEKIEKNDKNINKFVHHEYREVLFNEMINEISHCAEISVNLLREFTEKALVKWEKSTKRDVLTLFVGSDTYRFHEIQVMCDYLRFYLEPIIPSNKKLEKSMRIACGALEQMYHTY